MNDNFVSLTRHHQKWGYVNFKFERFQETIMILEYIVGSNDGNDHCEYNVRDVKASNLPMARIEADSRAEDWRETEQRSKWTKRRPPAPTFPTFHYQRNDEDIQSMLPTVIFVVASCHFDRKMHVLHVFRIEAIGTIDSNSVL